MWYIFVSRSRVVGASARDLMKQRLVAGSWPLYAGTRHKWDLQRGDRVLLYAAGADPDGGFIVGSADILGACTIVKIAGSPAEPKLRAQLRRGRKAQAYAVPIGNPMWFPVRVGLKSVVEQLSSFPSKESWGARLQGGVMQIGEEDFSLLWRSGHAGAKG
jgi:hypothetical protein